MKIEDLERANKLKRQMDLIDRKINEINCINEDCSCFFISWTDDRVKDENEADPCINLDGDIRDEVLKIIKDYLYRKRIFLKEEFENL